MGGTAFISRVPVGNSFLFYVTPNTRAVKEKRARLREMRQTQKKRARESETATEKKVIDCGQDNRAKRWHTRGETCGGSVALEAEWKKKKKKDWSTSRLARYLCFERFF